MRSATTHRRRPGPGLTGRAAVALAFGLAVALPAGAPAAAAEPPPATGASTGPDTLAWSVEPVEAADGKDRSSFFLTVTEGQVVQDTIRVRNLGRTSLPLSVYATDAVNTDSGSTDLLPAGQAPEDVGAWITLDRDKVTLAPRESVEIGFTMKVPANAEAGDHTGGIVTSYLSPGQSPDGQSVMLDQRLASRVAVRVDGELRPAITVSGMSAGYSGTVNPAGKGRMNVTYTVANTGNVRLGAQQELAVKGPLGLTGRAAKLEAMPELLPGNKITIQTSVPGVWPAFRTSAKVELRPVPTRPGDAFPDLAAVGAASGTWAVPWSFLVFLLLTAAGTSAAMVLLRQARAREQRRVEAAVQERLRQPDLTPPG